MNFEFSEKTRNRFVHLTLLNESRKWQETNLKDDVFEFRSKFLHSARLSTASLNVPHSVNVATTHTCTFRKAEHLHAHRNARGPFRSEKGFSERNANVDNGLSAVIPRAGSFPAAQRGTRRRACHEGGGVNGGKDGFSLYRGQVWETRKRKVASDQCWLVHCTLRQAREGGEGLSERSAGLIFLWAPSALHPPRAHRGEFFLRTFQCVRECGNGARFSSGPRKHPYGVLLRLRGEARAKALSHRRDIHTNTSTSPRMTRARRRKLFH